MYRRGLEQLPPVNYVTAKRLMGHLHFIHLQSQKNLMPVENLSALWGPTLMQAEVHISQNYLIQTISLFS
jgi:hypothetical protein